MHLDSSVLAEENVMTPSNPYSDDRNAGNMSDDAGHGATKQKAEEDARNVKREAGARTREKAEAGQHQVAGEADALSDAIDAAASNLDDHDREGLARYARELSSNLENAAGQLEERSVDELANDAKRLARNNPAMFMLGSIGVGFGLSRFFKASAERDHHDDESDNAAKDDDVSTSMPMHGRQRDMTETNTTPTTPGNGHGREML